MSFRWVELLIWKQHNTCIYKLRSEQDLQGESQKKRLYRTCIASKNGYLLITSHKSEQWISYTIYAHADTSVCERLVTANMLSMQNLNGDKKNKL